MSETTNVKVASIRQEIGDLRTRMNEFSRAVEMQRRALRQLQMAVGSIPQAQRVVQNATNARTYVSNAAQQIASRLPIFEKSFNSLRADIDAMEKEHTQQRAH